MDDWRLTNQKAYLQGQKLVKKFYVPYSETWTHEHCKFCSIRISKKDEIRVGYCTEDEYHWICETCFNDFKESFEWVVIRDETTGKEKPQPRRERIRPDTEWDPER